MQDQRYSDELKYVTLKGVKTSSKNHHNKWPQELPKKLPSQFASKSPEKLCGPKKGDYEQCCEF